MNTVRPSHCLAPRDVQVGIKVDDELVQDTFAVLDKCGHHKISWAELWAAMAPTPTDVLRELRVAKNKKRLTVAEMIQPYDSNADKILTPGEFHKLLDGFGFDLDDSEVRYILHQIDLDGNRQVSCKDLEYALDQLGGGTGWFCKERHVSIFALPHFEQFCWYNWYRSLVLIPIHFRTL